jgi:fructose/tagatose bisphosphate aldolase
MKYFFGVISKNQVDSIIDFSLENTDIEIFFIPSRRQVEYNGGYANNWTTKSFTEYVKNLNPKIKIERDHGGPGQGLNDDDGFISLEEDCKYFDIIHIDPWKKFPNINEGIKWTINMINYCYKLNPNIEYEIGTEEAIRLFTVEEIEHFIREIKNHLDECVYKKIKYFVIQCGNCLSNGKNIGSFDKDRLKMMIEIIKKYNFISKEHNGDWVAKDIIKKKENLGLECINIAPEFGEIESNVILNNIKCDIDKFNKIYNLCLESEKWKKWVSNDFDYKNKKNEIILITCHYIYNNNEFNEIKKTYLNIDNEIKKNIKNKLNELYN